jgi:hypothetical protein
MQDGIKPVGHCQNLLRRSLYQGGEPFGCLGLFLQLNGIHVWCRLFRRAPSRRSSPRAPIHTHRLLCVLFCSVVLQRDPVISSRASSLSSWLGFEEHCCAATAVERGKGQ